MNDCGCTADKYRKRSSIGHVLFRCFLLGTARDPPWHLPFVLYLTLHHLNAFIIIDILYFYLRRYKFFRLFDIFHTWSFCRLSMAWGRGSFQCPTVDDDPNGSCPLLSAWGHRFGSFRRFVESLKCPFAVLWPRGGKRRAPELGRKANRLRELHICTLATTNHRRRRTIDQEKGARGNKDHLRDLPAALYLSSTTGFGFAQDEMICLWDFQALERRLRREVYTWRKKMLRFARRRAPVSFRMFNGL